MLQGKELQEELPPKRLQDKRTWNFRPQQSLHDTGWRTRGRFKDVHHVILSRGYRN